MVQNYMEVLIENTLQAELTHYPGKYETLCRCPACMALAKATALNLLPPFYITCVAGEVYGEYRAKELQYKSDILVAVGKGIEAAIRGGHKPGQAAPRD